MRRNTLAATVSGRDCRAGCRAERPGSPRAGRCGGRALEVRGGRGACAREPGQGAGRSRAAGGRARRGGIADAWHAASRVRLRPQSHPRDAGRVGHRSLPCGAGTHRLRAAAVAPPPDRGVSRTRGHATTSSTQSIAERETLEGAVSAVERLAKTGDRSLIVPMTEATRIARFSQAALLKALGLFDPKPEGWTPLLVGYLDSRDPKVREAALALLGRQTGEKDVDLGAARGDLARPGQFRAWRSAVEPGARRRTRGGGGRCGGRDARRQRRRDAPQGRRNASAKWATARKRSPRRQRCAWTSARVPSLTALAEPDPDPDVRAEARRRSRSSAATLRSTFTAAAAGRRARHESARRGRRRCVAARAQDHDGIRVLVSGAVRTDVSVVGAFLDAGMSSSAPVAGNGPPLVVALQVGNACAPGVRPTKADIKSLVKLLLDAGRDANGGVPAASRR